MLKFFFDWAGSLRSCSQNEAFWRQDPLAHPDIRRMSPYELADLVVPPETPTPVARAVKRSASLALNGASPARQLPAGSACC